MSAMVAEEVVMVVFQKLADMLKDEKATHCKAIVKQLDEIREALDKAGALINTEDGQTAGDGAAMEYLSIVYGVEDVIEKFSVRIARQRKGLCCYFINCSRFSLVNWIAYRNLQTKMKRFRNRIDTFNNKRIHTQGNHVVHNHATDEEGEGEERRDRETEILDSSLRSKFRIHSLATRYGEHLKQSKLMFNYSFNEELGIFVPNVNELVDRLIKADDHLVVSVYGVMGSGKTTLARAIYGRRDIREHFKCRAFICVLKEFSIIDLLLSLLKQVGSLKDHNRSPIPDDERRLGKRLLKHLEKNRFLVVLDDVPTSDDWEKLKNFFPDRRNGSKIILTTRKAAVAGLASPKGSHYDMKPLRNSDSWEMFLKKAGWEEISPLNRDNHKQKILEICAGLPLNIVLLGGLLSTNERIEQDEWPPLILKQVKWHTSDILSLSYRDLCAHSKLCLLYMVLFPKEFDIPVRRLLRLWQAEGIVKPSNPTEFPEDVVQGIFEDLVKRSMVQISKLRSDGSPRKCRLLDVLHDYLLPKAQYIRLFYLHRSSSSSDYQVESKDQIGIRRMVEYKDIKNFNLEEAHHQVHLLRSYLSFNFPWKDIPATEVGRFLGHIIDNGFGLLRVLDLEGVYKPKLPEKLGDLYNLRYLGLRWTFLDTLPTSVGDLPFLETLDVKHTYINSLPNSIWKLKHLRHLNLNEMRLDMPMQLVHDSPTLLTLWGLFVNDKSLENNGLTKLCHLRELGISFDLNSSQENLFSWIEGLTDLQSLRLRSKDSIGRPSSLHLRPLPRLEKLSHLHMMGNMQKLPDQLDFPSTLKVLTLSVSQLNEDPMPTLGHLPSLTVLRLLANSFLGRKMHCGPGTFGKLRVLKLWMLKALEVWNVDEEAMVNLKELNIRCCHKLKTIPPKVMELKKLDEIILTNMPEEFTISVQGRKPECMSITVHRDWEFTPLPWEQEDAATASI